jgi:PknH-like extracellular domain
MVRLGVPFFLPTLLAVILVAGCSSTTSGRAVAAVKHAARPLAAADLESVLLTPAQLSDIVGAALVPRVDQKRPVGGGPSGPCAALDSAGSDAFVGNDFSGFHVLLAADGTEIVHDHIVTEAGTVYPDAATAAKQFGAATGALGACNGRHVREMADWRYAVNDVTADTVRWNKEQTDAPALWVCYGQGRVRNNVIVEAMACQGDDTGAQKADTIVNRMSASVWELSGG